MKRVLFVDDEPRILDGLRRMLRGVRDDWDMTFVASGGEAVAQLAARPFDVVVTDMRMPGMDGAALLQHLQERHPEVIRIVLSGHTELEAALRAIPCAHQFLSKPCDAGALRAAVDRSCELRSLLGSEQVRAAVNGVRSLPVVPDVYRRITAALQRPDIGMGEVAALVEQDPAICAKLLQVVNSGFFGLPRKVARIAEAVTFLGLVALRDLVLSAGVFRQVAERRDLGFDPQQFQTHATLTARIAREIQQDRRWAQEAFTAGMLHDLGRVLVGDAGKDGVSHPEAGGYLLALWGLPFPIVEAVSCHHAPGTLPAAEFGLVGTIHVAQSLAAERLAGRAGSDASHQLDVDYLDRVGATAKVAEWRAMVAGLASGS